MMEECYFVPSCPAFGCNKTSFKRAEVSGDTEELCCVVL